MKVSSPFRNKERKPKFSILDNKQKQNTQILTTNKRRKTIWAMTTD